MIAILLSLILLNVILLNVLLLNVILLNVILLNVLLLNVLQLNFILLIVILLNVILLNVVSPVSYLIGKAASQYDAKKLQNGEKASNNTEDDQDNLKFNFKLDGCANKNINN